MTAPLSTRLKEMALGNSYDLEALDEAYASEVVTTSNDMMMLRRVEYENERESDWGHMLRLAGYFEEHEEAQAAPVRMTSGDLG